MHFGKEQMGVVPSLQNLEKDVRVAIQEGKVGSQWSWAMQGVPGGVAVSEASVVRKAEE